MNTFDETTRDPEPWGTLLASRDGLARQAARETLVRGGHLATPVLVTLLGDARTRVRWEAALALKEIADPAAAQPLALALGDEDRDVRWVAGEALAAIGRPGLGSLLGTLVNRADSFEFREAAEVAVSLIRSRDEAALLAPLLRDLREGKPPEVVAVAAADALEALTATGPVGA